MTFVERLYSPAVASLPASAGNNSRGLHIVSNSKRRQLQGHSTANTPSEEESDDRDNQVEDDKDKKADSSESDKNDDKNTARTEKHLRLYSNFLAKSGTI